MCQFPYSQGLSRPDTTGIHNPLPVELLGNVSIFCNTHNCQLPNPEPAHVLSTCSLQQRERTWKRTVSIENCSPGNFVWKILLFPYSCFHVFGRLAFTISGVILSVLSCAFFFFPPISYSLDNIRTLKAEENTSLLLGVIWHPVLHILTVWVFVSFFVTYSVEVC